MTLGKGWYVTLVNDPTKKAYRIKRADKHVRPYVLEGIVGQRFTFEELEVCNFTELVQIGDYHKAVSIATRQVKWLYNNSNRMLQVVPEKDVRYLVFHLQQEIKSLTEQLKGSRMYADIEITSLTDEVNKLKKELKS